MVASRLACRRGIVLLALPHQNTELDDTIDITGT